MLSRKDLQELVEFQAEGALVLSLYLDTELNRQPKEKVKLTLRERLRGVIEKGLNKDMERILQFFDYDYDWQAMGVALFSCQERGFWRAYSLAVPVRNILFVAEQPYVKPLSDLLDEYGPYGVVLVDQEGARLFGVQLGEIQEENEILGEVVKHHKQGGRSQAGYQRKADNQAQRNLKIAAEAAKVFCEQKECKGLVMAGSEGVLAQFREMLPKKLQKDIIGVISAEMTTPVDDILKRSMEVWLAAKHKQEDEMVEQMVTTASKGEASALGMADTLYAVREGRVHRLLVEQGYEVPGALCDHCGYVSCEIGQAACLFCGNEMRVVENAVDLAVQKVLESGGQVVVIVDNEALTQAGHIGAILRY